MQNFTLLESIGCRKIRFTFQSRKEAAGSQLPSGAPRSLAPWLERAVGGREKGHRVSGLGPTAYPGGARRARPNAVVHAARPCAHAACSGKPEQGCLGLRVSVARRMSSSADFSLGVAPRREKAPPLFKSTLQRLPSTIAHHDGRPPRNDLTPFKKWTG